MLLGQVVAAYREWKLRRMLRRLARCLAKALPPEQFFQIVLFDRPAKDWL